MDLVVEHEGMHRILELRGILRAHDDFTLLAANERDASTKCADRRPPRHRVEGRLLDRDQRILAAAFAVLSRPFKEYDCAAIDVAYVRVELPLHSSANSVVLMVDGHGVWSAPIGLNPPTLRGGLARHGEEIEVAWEVVPTVPVDVYAVDTRGNGRRIVARQVKNNSIRISATQLAGGRLSFLLRAVSQMRETRVMTEPIDLPERAPVIEIINMTSSGPFGQPMTVNAVLVDGWGRTSQPPFEWTLDGQVVAHGPNVTVAPEPGRHELVVLEPLLNLRAMTSVDVREPTTEARRWQDLVKSMARGST